MSPNALDLNVLGQLFKIKLSNKHAAVRVIVEHTYFSLLKNRISIDPVCIPNLLVTLNSTVIVKINVLDTNSKRNNVCAR